MGGETSDARKRREEVRQAQAAVQESFNRSHAEFAVREDESPLPSATVWCGHPDAGIAHPASDPCPDPERVWDEDFPEPAWSRRRRCGCPPQQVCDVCQGETDYVPSIPSTPEYIRSLCVKIKELEAKVAKLEAHTCACETVIGAPIIGEPGPLDLASQGMPLDEHGRFQTALPDPVEFR